jgi:hypothetical protein
VSFRLFFAFLSAGFRYTGPRVRLSCGSRVQTNLAVLARRKTQADSEYRAGTGFPAKGTMEVT